MTKRRFTDKQREEVQELTCERWNRLVRRDEEAKRREDAKTDAARRRNIRLVKP